MKFNQVDEIKFYNSINEAKLKNNFGCYLSLYEKNDYKNFKNFLLDEGVAGFSVKPDGDLVSVFKNPELAKKEPDKYKNVIDKIMMVALQNNATKMDCYGNFLASVYMNYGFIPVGKVKFNKEYCKNWDTEKHGTPDVIALCRVYMSSDELIKRRSQNEFYDFYEINEKIPYFDNYEDLLNYRDKLFDHIKNNALNYNQAIKYVINKNNEKEVSYE